MFRYRRLLREYFRVWVLWDTDTRTLQYEMSLSLEMRALS